ncbi:MAG TPA: cyclic nucleotide-binding domain-containing protein [Acidimicrobiales bacterium]|jgi:CRP/FNR family transcriptional regulator
MARKQAQTEPHPFAANLQAVDLFEDLEPRELDVLANVARDYHFAPGEVVVAEGDQSGRFHLIVSGQASASVGGRVVAQFGPGHYFGEMAMIDRQPRSATVTADEDLATLSLASITVRPLLREHPEIALKMLEKLCARLRATDAKLH